MTQLVNMFSFLKKKEEDPCFEESNKICPVCLIKMGKIVRSSVVIDFCSNCHGIYLDDGELDKLVEFTKSGNKLEI